MAFKDGMNAISTVLKVLAIACASLGVLISAYVALNEERGADAWIGAITGLFLFAILWTPSWVIRKFTQ